MFLVSDDRRHLLSRTSEAEGGEPFSCPLNHGLAAYVALTGEKLCLRDAQKDERFNSEMDKRTGYLTRQVLCLPIICGERVAGVCQCLNKQGGGEFTPKDEEVRPPDPPHANRQAHLLPTVLGLPLFSQSVLPSPLSPGRLVGVCSYS